MFKITKIIMAVLAILTIVVFFSLLVLKEVAKTELEVKVLDYDYSVCTQDFPSSSCTGYAVTVQLTDGETRDYLVPGFDDGDNKQYYEISSKMRKAEEQMHEITIVLNNENEIISVK